MWPPNPVINHRLERIIIINQPHASREYGTPNDGRLFPYIMLRLHDVLNKYYAGLLIFIALRFSLCVFNNFILKKTTKYGRVNLRRNKNYIRIFNYNVRTPHYLSSDRLLFLYLLSLIHLNIYKLKQ